jgi:CHASE2 domain-containing sensor protein
MRQESQKAQGFLLGFVFSIVIAGIAWFWKWPAHMFVFWSILSILTLVTQMLLVPVCRALEPPVASPRTA